MRMFDIISKKKYGEALSKEEIDYVIKGYTEGTIPDYQMSALLMAIYFEGMTYEETSLMTLAMADSGDRLDLSGIDGINVDKHSTGGVGDKTTLILAPMVAACGGKVAKMSGRGLGNTGGTIDKLESIPGFRTALTEEEFIKNVNETGLALTGQTGNLAPADKKIYALRDVTASVDSIPLIASSIMSKKIASGADAIVLDVKVGNGAFMKNMQDAEKLAQQMVMIGTNSGRNTIAVISDMNEPLGYAVGNALEVNEAVDTLKGRGPEDVVELCLELGAQMLIASEITDDRQAAVDMLKKSIEDGSAYAKFTEFVKRQGGDVSLLDACDSIINASYIVNVVSENSGYVSSIQSELIGETAMILGGGRQNKGDDIDHSVGVVLSKKVGDKVDKGDVIATIYANDKDRIEAANELIVKAFAIQKEIVDTYPLIKRIISCKNM